MKRRVVTGKRSVAWKPVWFTVTQVAFVAEAANGRVLSIVVSPDTKKRFTCVAIESSAKAKSLDGLFGNHAHAIVGEGFTTPAKAKSAAERYAKTWLKRSSAAERCVCKTIDTKKRAA